MAIRAARTGYIGAEPRPSHDDRSTSTGGGPIDTRPDSSGDERGGTRPEGDDLAASGHQVQQGGPQAAAPEPDAVPGRRRRGPIAALGAGLLVAIALFVVLVLPVVAMLLVSPRGQPTALPPTLAVVVLIVIGVAVGLLLLPARTRAGLGITASVVLLVFAVWTHHGTWWATPGVPAPPLALRLGGVPATVALVAGVGLGAALVTWSGSRPAPRHAPSADRGSARMRALLVGAVGAGGIVLVAEAAVWGRRVQQRTFEGPFGLDVSTWLLVVFLATIVAGILLGWAATSARHRPVAPAVGAVVLVVVAALALVMADAPGPPRTTLYGLALGLLLLGLVAPLGRRRARAG